jgi:leukotriene-A4 hydrolase
MEQYPEEHAALEAKYHSLCEPLYAECANVVKGLCLAVAAEDESILPTVVRCITTQGRMEFVRPLYRSLFHSSMGKKLEVKTFLANKDFYHPIRVNMVATDLSVKNSRGKRFWIAGAVMVGAVVGLVLFRKRR